MLSAHLVSIFNGRTGRSSPRTLTLGEGCDKEIVFDFSPSLDCQYPDPNALRFVLHAESREREVRSTAISGMQSIFASLDLSGTSKHLALSGQMSKLWLRALTCEDVADRIRMFRPIKMVSLNDVELGQAVACLIAEVLEGTQVSKIKIKKLVGHNGRST